MARPMYITTFFLILALILSLTSLPAYALSLSQAKAQGLVGEQSNGYLGSVKPHPSAQISALVSHINAKRRAQYLQIAKKNNTNLSTVEKIAAATAIRKTLSGHYVRAPNGQWLLKR